MKRWRVSSAAMFSWFRQERHHLIAGWIDAPALEMLKCGLCHVGGAVANTGIGTGTGSRSWKGIESHVPNIWILTRSVLCG
jgi:hypothetical protein